MIWLCFYIADCELMNIGTMRYINGLTMNKNRVLKAWSMLYLFWIVTIRQITVKYVVRFSISILSAQKGAKLLLSDMADQLWFMTHIRGEVL